MPRLFTALEIPAPIAFSLSLLRGGLPGARWVDPENYHITLRFIGDIDHRTADEVARGLAKIDRPSFELSLEGLDALSGRKPHSIAACVKASPELRELQAQQERIIQRMGLEPERRRFRPHVTLARIRSVSQEDAATYLALRGDFRTAPFPVGRFVLLSSRDSKGGGPYIMEEAYPLAA
jgi:2'-5' RNA ligase